MFMQMLFKYQADKHTLHVISMERISFTVNMPYVRLKLEQFATKKALRCVKVAFIQCKPVPWNGNSSKD